MAKILIPHCRSLKVNYVAIAIYTLTQARLLMVLCESSQMRKTPIMMMTLTSSNHTPEAIYLKVPKVVVQQVDVQIGIGYQVQVAIPNT